MFNIKFRNVILASAFLGWGCGTSGDDSSTTVNTVGSSTDTTGTGTMTGAPPTNGTTTGNPTATTPTTGGTGTGTTPTGTGTGTTPTGSNTGNPPAAGGTGNVGPNPTDMPTMTGTATGPTPTGSETTGPVASGAGGTGGMDPNPNTGGTGGMDPGPAEDPTPANLVVTSANNAWWVETEFTDGGGSAAVTVSETEAQTWDGFGGSFNEIGWDVLTSQALKDEAIKLLFSATEGANLAWGRIPMGASDYAKTRYTLDDTGTNIDPVADGNNRPPADLELANFSLARDGELLIPFIKAAQALKDDIRFWASPWTPPVWMKTGYKTNSGGRDGGDAKRPSYFDGGNMSSDQAVLAAYAQYFVKFVNGYKEQGINVEVVSPQNEPGYDQNYPSCLWDSATYISFVGQHLGPAMKELGVDVMLGTMSNAGDNNVNDLNIASALMADATAKTFVTVGGAQWGVLGKVNEGSTFGGLPIWATEHKCGNYPWDPAGFPAYDMSKAPNDLPYGVESWGYIRDAINKGKVTAYNAWNMVLDTYGLGNDESRHWGQNALLVVDGGAIKPTPYYYVFRHIAQYVTPGAKVLSAGNDAIAFKNPNGSYVAAIYNSGAANPNYVVSIGGKNVTFAMPGAGWATVKVTP